MDSWSTAFARQAASDLEIRRILGGHGVADCHRLHYLQMWLEKLCKADLWLPDARAGDNRFHHNVVAKVLPRLIQENWKRLGFKACPDI